jgi:hypothetical protein
MGVVGKFPGKPTIERGYLMGAVGIQIQLGEIT